MPDTLTTCVYCGCGCGLYLHTAGGRVVGASPSRQHPVSRGNLCVKGWHVHQFIHHHQRLTTPLLRQGGQLQPASWEEALEVTAQALRKTGAEAGGQAIGVLASARCTNEENYLLQKFTRAVLKSNNIDQCARL